MDTPLYKLGTQIRFTFFDNHSTTGVVTVCGTRSEKYTVRCTTGRFYRVRESEIIRELYPPIHAHVRELVAL